MPAITSRSPLHSPSEESASVVADDTNRNDSETSPETAAVARGAAASARHSVRTTASTAATSVTKGSVGRLPVTASNASRLPSVSSRMAKPPLAKSLPRGRGAAARPTPAVRAGKASRVKVNGPPRANQTIAKATDRFSTGLDVWNAAKGGGDAEEGLRDNSQRRSKWNSLIPSFGQVAAFTRIFVTNTVLGMAVFVTYEGIVDYVSLLEDKGDILDQLGWKSSELKNIEEQNEMTISQFNGNDATINITDRIEQNSAKEVGNDTIAQISILTHNQSNNSENESGNSDRVSIPLHFLAGGLGGASHAILSLVLETKVSMTHHSGNLNTTAFHDRTKSTLISIPKPMASLFRSRRYPSFSTSISPSNNMTSSSFLSLQYPVINYSIATIAHHSLAHAVLFGTYQWIKRSLSEGVTFYSRPIDEVEAAAVTSEKKSSGIFSSYVNNNKDLIAHAAVIALAGGIAGQAQHLTSHFTEQWFCLTTTMIPEQKSTSKGNFRLRWRVLWSSWPAWRSTVLAFPPSAIGFLAFEYGKAMV
ncbi:hypothetical protein HJC23_004845 [Cyclotella cryptica]|uniref:Uncharacterized protein n=1 Tax=Cyclotella cryptica TaxID=29204 RepID=A0ABD3P303_9STRA|eukprot:CCRYP_018289-RA/>CCRYP_018289-RA protein AED:0.27 eAED:0.27 QI:0/-1/0/1/-1/1/1/0/532